MKDYGMLGEDEVRKMRAEFKANIEATESFFRMMHDFEIVQSDVVPGYAFRVRNRLDGRELCVCKTRNAAELVVMDNKMAVSHIAYSMAMQSLETKVKKLMKEKEDERIRDFCVPRPEPAKPSEKTDDGGGGEKPPTFVSAPNGGYEWQMPPVVGE